MVRQGSGIILLFAVYLWIQGSISIGARPLTVNSVRETGRSFFVRSLNPEEAIERALRKNADLRLLLFERDLQQEKIKVAYRKFLPSLEAGYTQNDSVTYSAVDSHAKKISLGISQLLFDGGKLSRTLKNMKEEFELSSFYLKRKREEIIFSVITLYMEILKLTIQSKIEQDSLNLALEQRMIAREERQLGLITAIELLEIELAIKDLELQSEKTLQEKSLLSQRLAWLVDLPLTDLPQLKGEIDRHYSGFLDKVIPPKEITPDFFIHQALKYNRDLLIKRYNLLAEKENLKHLQFSWLPYITADLSIGISGDEFPLSKPGFNIGIKFDFELPLFPSTIKTSAGKSGDSERSRGFSISGEPGSNTEGVFTRKEAQIEVSKLVEEIQKMEKNIEFTVYEQLLKLKNKKTQLDLLRDKLRLIEERESVEALRLKLGEIKRVDYLSTRMGVARQRIEILEAVATLYTLETTLLKTTGAYDLSHTWKYIILSDGDYP